MVGHIAAKCQTGKGAETGWIPTEKPQGAVTTDMEIDEIYRPLVSKGHIYEPKKKKIAVTILIDTGASQSILLKEKIVTRGAKSRAGKDNRQRNRRKEKRFPLREVELESKWKTGPIIVGVIDSQPMKGISLLSGNDVGAGTFSRKRTKLNATNGREETTTRLEKGYNLRNRSRSEEMEDEVNEISRTGKFREELILENYISK